MFLIPYLLKFGVSEKYAKALAVVILIAAIALAVTGSIWGVYHHGRVVERAIWVQKIAEYEQKLKDNQKVYDLLVTKLKADNAELVMTLELKLKASEERKDKVKVIVKEVIKYVTPKADAQCVLTTGFSWMYNVSLDTPSITGVPPSKPEDVDSPSGIAISEVAAIASSNNGECAARGEVISAWQEWYVKEKGKWDAFRAAVPAAPAVPN